MKFGLGSPKIELDKSNVFFLQNLANMFSSYSSVYAKVGLSKD